MSTNPSGAARVTARRAERSTAILEVELSAERVRRSVDESVRHLGRRTRVPGFRPGKVPRLMLERALGVRRGDPDAPNPIYDDAKEHLFEASVIDALRESELDPLTLPPPEWLAFEEESGARYRVTFPVRPEVELGAYTGYPFGIKIPTIDDARVDAVVEQLRDQHATLVPVEDRAAAEDDYAVIRYEARRDGAPVDGMASERMPLILGRERFVPGFEEQIVGLREGEGKAFPLTLPDDHPDESLAGRELDFEVTLLEVRAKRLPEADDDFARSVGTYQDLEALRQDVRQRLERNALDQARHAFADRIIEFAVANATLDVPELLVEREMELMLDQLKVRLASQGIGYEEYLRATERDEAALREEYRQSAERRVKTLLVVSAIADREEVDVTPAEVEAHVARLRATEPDDARSTAFLDSDRGRSFIRTELRRSKTIETLIDRWIAEHPELRHVRHLEDEVDVSPSEGGSAQPSPAPAEEVPS